jgi:hypothetical protein
MRAIVPTLEAVAPDGRAENHDRIPPRSRSLPIKTTEHPALIPQKAPGGSRRRPPIPARLESEDLALAGNPRLSPLNPVAP